MALNFGEEGENFGFSFKHSSKAGQGIENTKRIETATVVVAKDESGDFQDIAEAIKSLDDKGGYIQIKEGDYYVKDKINIPSNVRIEGVGFNTRIIRTTDGHIFENRDIVAGNENIAIKNIRFRGTNSGLNAGIRLKNCKDCKIEGINTEQLYQCVLLEISIRTIIKDCVSLDSNLGYGVYADGCLDCNISDNALYGESASINLLDCENCIISRNICNDAGDIGISLDADCNRNIITSNMAADCTTGIYCNGDYNTISTNCAENGGIWLNTASAFNTVVANIGQIFNSGTSNTVTSNITI